MNESFANAYHRSMLLRRCYNGTLTKTMNYLQMEYVTYANHTQRHASAPMNSMLVDHRKNGQIYLCKHTEGRGIKAEKLAFSQRTGHRGRCVELTSTRHRASH